MLLQKLGGGRQDALQNYVFNLGGGAMPPALPVADPMKYTIHNKSTLYNTIFYSVSKQHQIGRCLWQVLPYMHLFRTSQANKREIASLENAFPLRRVVTQVEPNGDYWPIGYVTQLNKFKIYQYCTVTTLPTGKVPTVRYYQYHGTVYLQV